MVTVMAVRNSFDDTDFIEPEDDFAEDDLFTADDNNIPSLVLGDAMQKSFLERDNFEKELDLAADDPFAEDFTDISQHDIVNVIADGDRVGRPIIVIYAYRFPSNKTFDHQKFLRYKKNLKALFLVHPTRFIRFVWGIFKPFISIKFERKVHYVNYLNELNAYLRVEQLNLPQPIKEFVCCVEMLSFRVGNLVDRHETRWFGGNF
ncbi:unnamed protein product [Anisakis simplex]|uniref:Rho GTPase-activating protein 68F (inferred by orthology to a D. melanogaster protein) n=1 Tax=Anisakis simplex TaxID=6269 RepID=A0A0M3J487_ANISI|nr:unnamed protein product [Anisakis simplex]